jgi:hypothetical protein
MSSENLASIINLPAIYDDICVATDKILQLQETIDDLEYLDKKCLWPEGTDERVAKLLNSDTLPTNDLERDDMLLTAVKILKNKNKRLLRDVIMLGCSMAKEKTTYFLPQKIEECKSPIKEEEEELDLSSWLPEHHPDIPNL